MTEAPLPVSEAFFRDPYPTFAQFRDTAPACRVDLPDGSPVWLVTRYRDAGQCSGLQAGGEGPRWEGLQARAVP